MAERDKVTTSLLLSKLVCKWGHVGLWGLYEVYDKKRRKVYQTRKCLECERIRAAAKRLSSGVKPRKYRQLKPSAKISPEKHHRLWQLRLKRLLYNTEPPY